MAETDMGSKIFNSMLEQVLCALKISSHYFFMQTMQAREKHGSISKVVAVGSGLYPSISLSVGPSTLQPAVEAERLI